MRGGAKHSSARDCLRIEPWLCGGVIVPGAGNTFGPNWIGKPTLTALIVDEKQKEKKEENRTDNVIIIAFESVFFSLRFADPVDKIHGGG